MQYKMGKFLSTTNSPTISLGTIDENGNPQDPAITMDPVSKQGMNLPSEKKMLTTLTNMVIMTLLRYWKTTKKNFKALIMLVQVSLDLTSQLKWIVRVCSISLAIYIPKGANTKIRTFEQSVISKHRLQRIFCEPKKVEKFYLKRHANNKWYDNGERDDKTFLQIEKDIYLEIFT